MHTNRLVVLLWLTGCDVEPAEKTEVVAPPVDPLPSWADGDTKREILDFVARVSTEGGPDYVAPGARVAVFDNDGTLWVEQPLYTEFAYTLDRVAKLAPEHPEWKTQAPYADVLAGHPEKAMADPKAAFEMLAVTHGGMTAEEFRADVTGWLDVARHPKFDRSYTELVYQPMIELLAHLHDRDFKTYIVSGGEAEFMRVFSGSVYGIPPAHVIGTTMDATFTMRGEEPVVLRDPKLLFVDDGPEKPEAIARIVAQRPILAFGNSDGDLQMLQWTAAGDGARLAALVHHTDADREYAYDRESHIGRLDKALDAAAAGDWVVVDTKEAWATVFKAP